MINFIKKYVVYFSLCILTSDALGVIYPKVNYMELTKEKMPHMQSLVKGALRATGLFLNSADMEKKLRMSALYPDLTARMHYYPEGLSVYDELSYQSSLRDDSNGNVNIENVDEYKQTGFSERTEWALTLEWNLTKLIHSHEERSLSGRRVQLASLNRRRTVDVARKYSQLMAALPNDSSESPDEGKMAIIYENAIVLDVWTDGMITEALLPKRKMIMSNQEEFESEPLKSQEQSDYEREVSDLLDLIDN